MTESTEKTQSYEEMFAHRFTAEDEEYQEYVKRPTDTPPIVEDWRGRGGRGNHRGRDYRYHDRRGHGGHEGHGGYRREGGRGWGGDQGWRGNSRGHQQGGYSRDRQDRDREWGHGSGHQSEHQSSNQGYSSDYQRLPKDCY